MTNPAVWYLMRATGVVALLLLTVASGLGVATAKRWRPPGSRLFVTTQIHRNASLLAVAFLAVHVLTSVVDPDAGVAAIAVVSPFDTPWALAAGTLSLDLLAAVVITSLGRRRLPHGLWRLIHRSAYVAWPLGVLHTIGMGTDTGTWWLKVVAIGCVSALSGVLAWRLSAREPTAA